MKYDKLYFNSYEKDRLAVLRDITDWEHISHGGKSTLEKEELRSPDRILYLIKYPREFEKGLGRILLN